MDSLKPTKKYRQGRYVTEFSPAPWCMERDPHYGTMSVCYTHPEHLVSEPLAEVFGEDEDEIKYNEQLITASPEMFNVLTHVEEYLAKTGKNPELLELVTQVIKKAND